MLKAKKYLTFFKISWQNSLVYRLNFIMWRLRNIIGLLTLYFLWSASFKNQAIFNWQLSSILTYILLASIFSSFVFNSKTADLAGKINSGQLSNFLVKPLSVFKYFFSLDMANKLLNTIFSGLEIFILILVLKPNIIFQFNFIYLFLTIFSLILSLIAYFFISFLIALVGFWTPEVWAPRFIFGIIISFASGSYFPLSFLPQPIYFLLKLTPFNYFIFFPIQIYLGNLNSKEIIKGFLILFLWIFILFKLAKIIWQKGIKSYESWGN